MPYSIAGQESAGIAVGDGTRRVVRGMGQVADAFKEDTIAGLGGHLAIGHTRYSTAGDSSIENAQPFLIDLRARAIAVGHNGNFVNAASFDDLVRAGSIFQTTSDTEVVLHLRAVEGADGRRGAGRVDLAGRAAPSRWCSSPRTG